MNNFQYPPRQPHPPNLTQPYYPTLPQSPQLPPKKNNLWWKVSLGVAGGVLSLSALGIVVNNLTPSPVVHPVATSATTTHPYTKRGVGMPTDKEFKQELAYQGDYRSWGELCLDLPYTCAAVDKFVIVDERTIAIHLTAPLNSLYDDPTATVNLWDDVFANTRYGRFDVIVMVYKDQYTRYS